MEIRTYQGGFDDNLSYLIWCKETKCAAIIDPSVSPTMIFETIEDKSLKLEKILITHTHRDHWQYIDDYLYKYPLIQTVIFHKPIDNVLENYRKVVHNEIISVGKNLLTVLHTPGHLEDSITFWDSKNKSIFTGDTMFIGRTGRTNNPHSDISKLYNSIYNILLKLPKNTVIYPGHNYGFSKTTTIATNIDFSPFFKCKSLNEFKAVMRNYEQNRNHK